MINNKTEDIEKTCLTLHQMVHDESRAIQKGKWDDVAPILRQKSRLLAKLKNFDFNLLENEQNNSKNNISSLISDIVKVEKENAKLLRDQMEKVQGKISHLKNAVRTTAYLGNEKKENS